MLPIHIKEEELFDESTKQFIRVKEENLKLEHSLISISKWEERWRKPFLTNKPKTKEELDSYISCMSITNEIGNETIRRISYKDMQRISDYIEAKLTATWFSKVEEHKHKTNEQVTSELIYYWMFSYGIPKECEKWHLSRLLTLIEIYQVKNEPEKKRSQSEIMEYHRQQNALRRAKAKK